MNKLLGVVLMPLLAMAALPAHGESGEWYVGAGVGQSKYRGWASDSDALALVNAYGKSVGVDDFDGSHSVGADDTDTAFKIFGGFRFNEYFGVEVSYLDMGEVEAGGRIEGTFYDVVDNSLSGDVFAEAKAGVEAFTIDLNAYYPLEGPAAVFFQVGAYQADVELELQAGGSITSENYRYSLDESSNGLHFGFGLLFDVSDRINIRAEWERLDNVEANEGESDVDLISAAVIALF